MSIQIENRDTRLFTLVTGEEHKEAVILLHGGPGVPEDMEPLMQYLSMKFRVIYFHQRGTLNSPCKSSDYTIESYLSDIDCIASHFRLQRFHVFGHSWGGLYAGLYAEKSPQRINSLFLCSPASGTGKQWLQMGLEVRKFNKKKSSLWEWWGMMGHSFMGTVGISPGHSKFFRQFAINTNKGFEEKKLLPYLQSLFEQRQSTGPIKLFYYIPLLHPCLPPVSRLQSLTGMMISMATAFIS